MTGMLLEDKVKDFILDNFLFTDEKTAISVDESFMNKGIVDSTGMLEIVNYIEEEFKIRVEDDELIPENLDSINNIVAFVEKKKND
jgi:acyl carrier protein